MAFNANHKILTITSNSPTVHVFLVPRLVEFEHNLAQSNMEESKSQIDAKQEDEDFQIKTSYSWFGGNPNFKSYQQLTVQTQNKFSVATKENSIICFTFDGEVVIGKIDPKNIRKIPDSDIVKSKLTLA